jgi:predicted phosphoribosyltransferase
MFADRTDAGIRLAHILAEHKGQHVVVYALPRGGVAVAVPVACALEAPLDLILVRKIGHPDFPEYAVGAVTEDGDVVVDEVVSLQTSSEFQAVGSFYRDFNPLSDEDVVALMHLL